MDNLLTNFDQIVETSTLLIKTNHKGIIPKLEERPYEGINKKIRDTVRLQAGVYKKALANKDSLKMLQAANRIIDTVMDTFEEIVLDEEYLAELDDACCALALMLEPVLGEQKTKEYYNKLGIIAISFSDNGQRTLLRTGTVK